MITLKSEQYIHPIPSRLLEVGCPNGVIPISRPDQITIVAKDVRSSLTGPMLLPSFIGEAGEGREE